MLGDDALQAVQRHAGQIGGGDVLADQHKGLRIDPIVGLHRHQPLQHAPPEVADIVGALGQVFVFHRLEHRGMRLDGLPPGARRPLPLADQRQRVIDQRAAFKHLRIGDEQRAFLGRQGLAHLLGLRHQLLAHQRHSLSEALKLVVDLLRLDTLVGDRAQPDLVARHHRFPHCHARRTRHAIERARQRRPAITRQLRHLAGAARMGDGSGELRRQRAEKGFLVIVERALPALRDDDAERVPVGNDRHAEEHRVGLLAGVLEQHEAAVFQRIVEADRLRFLGDQPDQPLPGGEPDSPDHFAVQTAVGHQHQVVPLARHVDEDGAGIDLERIDQAVDDDIERGLEIGGMVDLLDDALQGMDQRRHGGAASVGGGQLRLAAQLLQRAAIDPFLEIDDMIDRIPVVDPFPLIELGRAAGIEPQAFLARGQAQQEPFLLLPDAHRLAVTPHHAARQLVAQPAVGGAENPDIAGLEPDFLPQLAVHRLLCVLARIDAALRKLPGILPHAPGPEHGAIGVAQDNADIGAISIRINHLLFPGAVNLVCHSGIKCL